MSCTRRIAKLLSQATPHIEYLEQKVTENASAIATTAINKGREVLTKENAKKAYSFVQNAFAACRRKNKNHAEATAENTEATPAPISEERSRKKAM